MSITFPKFAKLAKLHIGWNVYFQETQSINVTFPTGNISYAKDFPALKYLTIWPVGFGKYPKIEDRKITFATPDAVWQDSGHLYETFLPC